jgi:hypothetical protein
METFLIRLWIGSDTERETESDLEPEGVRLQGFVRHVRSGSETRFSDAADLLVALSSWSERPRPGEPGHRTREPADDGSTSNSDQLA